MRLADILLAHHAISVDFFLQECKKCPRGRNILFISLSFSEQDLINLINGVNWGECSIRNVLNVQFRSHKIQRILGTRLYTCTKSAQFILNPPFACLESKKKSVVLQNWVGKWTDIVLNRDLKNFAGFP